jgi:topoisomerase (DNA) II binding protein 1
MDAENSQFCVNIFCVMPNNSTEATCPKDLFRAHECCKENGFNVNWIQEEACMKLKPCKEDVFILSEFVGPLFEFLRQLKCTVIGPQCLLVSVNKGEPLPDVPTPVFTVAMKGIIVTTTGCTPQEKKEIQEKVQYMGGLYSSAFSTNVTHLIVKSVADFSLKFKVAIKKDIPVMIPNWVDAVWNASIKESVHGTDPMFARYACPPFQGLVICVSQIPAKDREALKKIIEANGGRYSGQLELGKTNILITTSAEGEKYTYAKRWKIRCLKPEWIHTSLNKGYAADPDSFIMESKTTNPPRCSTPEADHSVMKFGNSSINSTIMNESRVQYIDETVGSTTSNLSIQHSDSRATEALDTLDLAISKKAGPFLDGCKVFISGFDGPHMEKLRYGLINASNKLHSTNRCFLKFCRRILNNAGVARFNSISESLSHVIVGKTVEEDWKQLQQLMHKPYVVTVEWVAQSLRLKRAAPEAAFLHPDFKNVIAPNKENASKKSIPEPSNNFQEDSQMVQQYLTTDHTEEEEVASLMNRPQGIFSGLTFQLFALDAETVSVMTDLILSNGGRVVAKNGRYVVTEPVSHTAVLVDQDGTYTVVNTLWIEDCVDEERLVDIENYHHHINVRDKLILDGYTVSYSGIQGRMRELLDILIVQLGGRPQETFSRKLMEEKKVYRSTHLVCAKTEGRKYEKALEWGVPAVSAEWVIACATSSTRPKEEDYPPTGEPVKPQELEESVPTPETVVRPSRQPAESVVLKTLKQKQSETPSARRLPAHFDMSSPHTPV